MDLKKLFVNDGVKGDVPYPKTFESVIAILKRWKPTDVDPSPDEKHRRVEIPRTVSRQRV